MISKLHYTFFLIFCLACARPNYQDPPTAQKQQKQELPANPTNPNEPIKKCDLFFSNARLCLDFKWEIMPTQTEMGSFLFKFYVQEKPNQFLDPKNQAFVALWMPSMGHGSRPVVVEKINTGEYKASKVFFIMPGEWQIRIQLKDEKNVVDEIIKKISI